MFLRVVSLYLGWYRGMILVHTSPVDGHLGWRFTRTVKI